MTPEQLTAARARGYAAQAEQLEAGPSRDAYLTELRIAAETWAPGRDRDAAAEALRMIVTGRNGEGDPSVGRAGDLGRGVRHHGLDDGPPASLRGAA